MKKEIGWWFPDHEQHLIEWMNAAGQDCAGRPAYQRHKYLEALKWTRPGRRLAVDVGAHIGLWSWQMAQDFGNVIAFEPMPKHAECFEENVLHLPNVFLHGVALGDLPGRVHFKTRTPDSSGDTGVEPTPGAGDVKANIDCLDNFPVDVLGPLDLLKIDCEGYELFVLKGAVETLTRCKPCVIVEQKPETGGAARYGIGVTEACDFLESLGAVRRAGIQGDYIYSWDEDGAAAG